MNIKIRNLEERTKAKKAKTFATIIGLSLATAIGLNSLSSITKQTKINSIGNMVNNALSIYDVATDLDKTQDGILQIDSEALNNATYEDVENQYINRLLSLDSKLCDSKYLKDILHGFHKDIVFMDGEYYSYEGEVTTIEYNYDVVTFQSTATPVEKNMIDENGHKSVAITLPEGYILSNGIGIKTESITKTLTSDGTEQWIYKGDKEISFATKEELVKYLEDQGFEVTIENKEEIYNIPFTFADSEMLNYYLTTLNLTQDEVILSESTTKTFDELPSIYQSNSSSLVYTKK